MTDFVHRSNPMSAVLHCTEEILEIVRPFAIEQALAKTKLDPTYAQAAKNPMRNVIEASRTILYCIEHQRRIVDDVLSLSKLDSGLVELVPCPVQVMTTVRQVVSIFERELKALDIALLIVEDVSLAELGLNWVMLDPNRFLQILINLVCHFSCGRSSDNEKAYQNKLKGDQRDKIHARERDTTNHREALRKPNHTLYNRDRHRVFPRKDDYIRSTGREI
jgi:hypothetical protein